MAKEVWARGLRKVSVRLKEWLGLVTAKMDSVSDFHAKVLLVETYCCGWFGWANRRDREDHRLHDIAC